MMMYKYIVKNVARRHGKTVTFMPKPIFGDNGSGMHTHQSIWKDGKPLFAGKEYAGVSQMCLHYIGGISEACARAGRLHESVDELVQAADAWI
jgi:glutamine synthetase